MNIQYHATSPYPVVENTDAVFQEISMLCRHFGGATNSLYPLSHGTYLPWRLMGFHQLLKLRRMDASMDFHHLFSAAVLPFPILKGLRKPIVYSVIAGLNQNIPTPDRFPSNTVLIVSNERDAAKLRQAGYNPFVIPPVINTKLFSYAPPPPSNEFTLLAGSAPWGEEQFASKGIDALLEAASNDSRLRLILLWRGVLYQEAVNRIKAAGLTERVEIINKRADVNQLLARADAAVVLAATPEVVKAWPHSLIESLVAGKPVIISQTIPMSDYVSQKQCGVVVDYLNGENLLQSIHNLILNYQHYQTAAANVGNIDFSMDVWLGKYADVYAQVA